MGDQVLLTVKKISKAFGPTRALIDVTWKSGAER